MGTKTGRDDRIQLNIRPELKKKIIVVCELEERDIAEIAEEQFREFLEDYPEDLLEKLISEMENIPGETHE